MILYPYTEHHGSYGFLSGDTHVTQMAGYTTVWNESFRLGFPKLLIVKGAVSVRA